MKMTRQAFAQRVSSPKQKVCLLLKVCPSMLILYQGPPATTKVGVNNDCKPSANIGGMTWPAYTNLSFSSNGEVGILGQTDEVKVTVRKAIYFMDEFIIFDNAFPDLATRATWARKALLKAANHLTQYRLTDYSHYLCLKKRSKEDPEYVKNLSPLVRESFSVCVDLTFPSSKLEQHISNLRRSIKLTSAAAARSVFQLHLKLKPPFNPDTLVKDITNYICPLAPNVSHIHVYGSKLTFSREGMLTCHNLMRMKQLSKQSIKNFSAIIPSL
jgi:hypothetical protein